MGRGRPSKYKPEYAEQAYKLCLLGATDKELASFFNTTEQTVNAWKGQYPEFLEALKRGKIEADAIIAQKLYHRAKGYEHPEDKIFLHEGKPVIVSTTKHYPPDTTAAIFWLKNRHPDYWRDKQNIEHTGQGGGPIEVKKYEQLDDAEIDRILTEKLAALGKTGNTPLD